MPKKKESSEKKSAKNAIDKSTEKKTLEAIKGSAGIISTIAKRLDMSWHGTEDRIKKYPAALKAFTDEREGILDMAEATILTAIKQGDTGSAKWLLSTIGKKRGFTEKIELDATVDNKVEIVLTFDPAGI